MMRLEVTRRIAGAIGGIAVLVAVVGAAAAQDKPPVAVTAPAPDAERMALAEDFADIVALAEIEGLLVRIGIDGTAWILDRRLPAATDAALREEIRLYVREALAPLVTAPASDILAFVRPRLAETAAGLYTTPELRAWLAFYATEAGRRLLHAQIDGLGVLIRVYGSDRDGPFLAALARLAPLNATLRDAGVATIPLPDAWPADPTPKPPVPGDAVVAARALIALEPKAFDQFAIFLIDDFVDSYFPPVVYDMALPAHLRGALRVAFTNGAASYFRPIFASVPYEMAALIAAVLTPAELAEAIAFHATPEAADWQRRSAAFRRAVEASVNDAPASALPDDGALERGFAEVGAGINAILAREGLPQLEF